MAGSAHTNSKVRLASLIYEEMQNNQSGTLRLQGTLLERFKAQIPLGHSTDAINRPR